MVTRKPLATIQVDLIEIEALLGWWSKEILKLASKTGVSHCSLKEATERLMELQEVHSKLTGE